MKKIIVLYFTLITMILAHNPPKKGLIFEDVPKNHWAYKAIDNLVQEGIISENSYLFKGEVPVSRYTFAEGLDRAFQNLNEKKANRGDLVILESLVYEFSRELTKIGFDSETFNGKIENIRMDIEFLKKKTDETNASVIELEKRVKALEEKTGI
ncbi:S-layer homology domain-containing protein [uncultured Cetobacterium sp.]|uniref:S-layer homology domain-containing protein n=1 Tax=uncultured Cetobacterium sp. TaxID=527638 RepID=UPI002621E482|nr:S-layer homology domain-containing protein [uncultured Cetobacterium sp.]